MTEKPLADKGLVSYRYKGMYGWIMIGAKSDEDALNEARRSTYNHQATIDNLQRFENGSYVFIK